MSLEEEIVVYQFAQGVRSEADLIDRFEHVNDDKKATRLFKLSSLLWRLAPFDADDEQLVISASNTMKDTPNASLLRTCDQVNNKLRLILNFSENGVDESHKLLLDLLKKIYQRRFELEKENPTKWWYQDLANSEIVQVILNRHQALVDTTYNNPSYRGEFSSIAKLWQEERISRQPKVEEPTAERQDKFTFLTYDDMITASINMGYSKQSRGIHLLSNSLRKAIIKSHQLDSDSANRVVWDVIERYLHETYNTTLH
jgi:hypothetical protein